MPGQFRTALKKGIYFLMSRTRAAVAASTLEQRPASGQRRRLAPGPLKKLLRRTCRIRLKPGADKFIAMAKTGGPEAYCELGQAIYFTHKGIFGKDPALAMEWLEAAAALGYVRAYGNLGSNAMFDNRYAEAAHYFTQAIQHGDGRAHLMQAYMMIFGLGFPKDVAGGFALLEEISAKTDPGYSLIDMDARKSLQTGTVGLMYILDFLTADQHIAMQNKDGSVNIPDLEQLFSGARQSETYLTGVTPLPKI